MMKVKVSKRSFLKVGIIVGVTCFMTSGYSSGIAAFAGPQSLLDPYADIQPALTPTTAKKPNALKKAPKLKQVDEQQAKTNELGNRTSPKNPNAKTIRAGKATTNKTVGKVSEPVGHPSNNSGLLSGIKEIQHGYVTSFKAAGHGIVNGSKAAGAKIAAGTKTIANGAKTLGGKVKDGFGAAGSKIASAPKAIAMKAPIPKAKDNEKTPLVFGNNPNKLATQQAVHLPPLPGKPLPTVSSKLPNARIAKAPKVKQPNIIARTFNKLNIFNKNKNAAQPAVNVAAKSPNGANQ